MTEVINIINGGYDCCPSYNGKLEYGHTGNRMEWFLKYLLIWTGEYPFSDLSKIPMPNCEPELDCSKLKQEGELCKDNCCGLGEGGFNIHGEAS